LQLPAIMQWLKQTFAVRFNRHAGRTGHIWGDRYWSRMLEGEPPEGAGEVDVAAETGVLSFRTCSPTGVSLLTTETPVAPCFRPKPRPIPASARLSTQTRPKTPREHRHKHPPQGRQATAPGEIRPILKP
jgi:hypothetical protein